MGHERATSSRARLSVGAHIGIGFAICIAAVSAVIASASTANFGRERARTIADLGAASQAGAERFTNTPTQVDSILTSLASAPDLTSFESVRCETALAALSAIASQGRLQLFDPDGHSVCGIGADEAEAEGTAGSWLAEVQASGQKLLPAAVTDTVTGHPSLQMAAPVHGTDGRTGALLALIYLDTPALEVPPGAPADTALIALDPERRTVLATTPGALVAAGPVDGTVDLAAVGDGQSATVTDGDGTRWLFTSQAVPELGWHVLAGRQEAMALAPAREAMWRMVGLGLIALLSMALVGVSLRNRLAKPLRSLGDVALRSAAGDDAARASVAGPREVQGLAGRMNDLLDERQAREADLRWRALHDVLTELPNRAAVAERLTELLDGSAETSTVLFVDLDRFKLVNDSHGHSIGDRLLVQLAERMRTIVGHDGVLGRFGGDEFLVVCPTTDVETARGVAQRLTEVIRLPFQIDDLQLYVTGSVGIAQARCGDRADDVVANADAAMYQAKARGASQVAVFDDSMRVETISRLNLERDLHAAVERDQLDVHFQPVVDLGTGAVVGAEALLRWHHPERGAVRPDEFIPAADESGLLLAIGDSVLRRALGHAVAWTAMLGRPFPVAVNVAASQLSHGDLVERVHWALADTRAQPELLCLEVTESGLLADPDLAGDLLRQLRQLGVRVALDDFGTGYSSLSYLQRLPLDVVKIDRSFVSRLDLDSTSNRIVRSVVELAGALGLDVVGEGVETDHQLRNLRRVGCQYGQGFLMARPMPAAAMDELMAAGGRYPVLAAAPALRRG